MTVNLKFIGNDNGLDTSLKAEITVGAENSSSGEHKPVDEASAALPIKWIYEIVKVAGNRWMQMASSFSLQCLKADEDADEYVASYQLILNKSST